VARDAEHLAERIAIQNKDISKKTARVFNQVAIGS